MVGMLQVQVKHPGIAMTERERKLIDSLVMRICVHQLYRRFEKSFRIRKSRVDSIHLLVNLDVVIEDGLTQDEVNLIIEDLTYDITQSLAFCEVATEEVLLTAKA